MKKTLYSYLAEAMLLASLEILSDRNNCSSPESAALEGIFNFCLKKLSKNSEGPTTYNTVETQNDVVK